MNRNTKLWFGITLLAAAASCLPGMPKSMKVVPASEAPAPEAGNGWHCYDYQQTKLDTHDGTTRSSSGDRCKRTLESCQSSAAELAATPTGGARDETRYQVGSCVTQASAACTYIWAGSTNAHECYRTMDSCSAKVGGMSYGDMKQSECAEYN